MPEFVNTSDVLNVSNVLRQASVNRVVFDAANPAHIDSMKSFVKSGQWGSVQFVCEYPFSDVPMTVLMKYAGSQLGVRRETAGERLARTQVKKKNEDTVNTAE